MGNTLKAVVSLQSSLARLARGAVVKGHRKVPELPLELYDAENCPYCRYVREALTELDLDAVVHPVPKGGNRFRPVLQESGGKPAVPFLYDPNTGRRLYESNDIVRYLYAEYGLEGRQPPRRLLPLSLLASTLRGRKGLYARPSKPAGEPLELYSFEASPYARLVRELLCELELPYHLHNVGKGRGKPADWLPPDSRKNYVAPTENRRRLIERGGKMMVPYLVDPNTGTALYESADIQRYLLETYGA
jgi:glutathione S-transferase